MPEDEDNPMRTEDSDSGTGSGSGSDSDSEEEQTELLVNTREKRSTAGNRLTSLIQQEADDELELLFEEAEDDAEFDDVDADSDVHMDSSDDDDDQGPAAGAEDLEGEKELQKQARAEKLAKRKKAGDGIPKVFKRVKIDPTASQSPAPRPKKKSERASWIPSADDAPTRASKRKSTKQSKEQLMAQMVDREIKRVKQLETMEKAQAAKEAAKKPAMTQADRLAEAARVEKKNAKSLSRWEEAEQQREEEQAAKLAALSNRQLNGPVITWWSGMGTWVGGILKKVGKTLELEDPKEKQSRKRKAAEMEADLAAETSATPIEQDQVMKDAPVQPTTNEEPNGILLPSTQPVGTPQPGNTTTPAPPTNTAEPSKAPVLTEGPKPSTPTNIPLATVPSIPAPPPTPIPSTIAPLLSAPQAVNPPPTNLPRPSHPPFILAPPQLYQPPPTLDGSSPLPGFGPPPVPRIMPSPFTLTPQNQLNQLNQLNQPPPPPPGPPPGPPPIEHATLNYVILTNFDEEAIKDKGVQTTILMNRKFVKQPRNKRDHELCAITGSKAAFRDPVTGLPYGNSHAYKEIQKLKRGEYRWSKLVGAYVGQGTYAARGVPPRFVNAKAAKVAVGSALMAPPTPQGVARASS